MCVVVVDGLDATAMVKVVVLDVNDNRPAFYPSTYTVNLEEDTSSNTEVVVVRATDKDTGVYGTLQYSISSGNTLGIFSIDRHSGKSIGDLVVIKVKWDLRKINLHSIQSPALGVDANWCCLVICGYNYIHMYLF